MIPYPYQAASMQNPHLARSIEEVVTNLKNLELCIDALRTDLVNVAESTGNVQAAQRLLTPAHLAASPWAGANIAPWDVQSQIGSIGNPLTQAPFQGARFDPFETRSPFASGAVAPGMSPFAVSPTIASPYAAQAFSPFAAASIPWQQAQLLRQAEFARQVPLSPFSQVSPFAAYASRTPYSAITPSSFVPQHASLANQAPFAAAAKFPNAPLSHHAAVGPF